MVHINVPPRYPCTHKPVILLCTYSELAHPHLEHNNSADAKEITQGHFSGRLKGLLMLAYAR